jgi:hypothetical protein
MTNETMKLTSRELAIYRAGEAIGKATAFGLVARRVADLLANAPPDDGMRVELARIALSIEALTPTKAEALALTPTKAAQLKTRMSILAGTTKALAGRRLKFGAMIEGLSTEYRAEAEKQKKLFAEELARASFFGKGIIGRIAARAAGKIGA